MTKIDQKQYYEVPELWSEGILGRPSFASLLQSAFQGFPDACGSRLGIFSARPAASSGYLVLQEWPRLPGLEKSATS